MNYENFTANMPSDRTMLFTSAQEIEEQLRSNGVEQLTRQLGKGPFLACIAIRSTEQADVYVDRYSTAVSLQLELPVGTVGFLFPRSVNGQFLNCGEEVGNSALITLPGGSALDIVTSGLSGSEAIGIPEARFNEMAQILCSEPEAVRVEKMTAIRGDTAQLHALRKAILELIAYPELDPIPEHLTNVLAATIAWMGDSSSQQGFEGTIVHELRTGVAKKAQEYIEEYYRMAVSIENLCRVTGVPARTLQRCFREYFDLSITNYLKMVRLNAAQRELTSAHPSEESVTNIAMNHGFTHLGRFSIEFRKHFGELPSETLEMQSGKKSYMASQTHKRNDRLE